MAFQKPIVPAVPRFFRARRYRLITITLEEKQVEP
jgi:hypothetical protein